MHKFALYIEFYTLLMAFKLQAVSLTLAFVMQMPGTSSGRNLVSNNRMQIL